MRVRPEQSAADRFLLPGLALFAMAWVIARAHVQSMTIDEATTYGHFVAPPRPSHWIANANNHVLNCILARLFTSVFGPSHLTVRAGAIAGAAIYIAATYFLSKLITSGPALRIGLFVCLVYNPFIFDYLVAARGYGLGIGFLAAAIYPITFLKLSKAPPRFSLLQAGLLSSVCAALSFSSNFSFAFVDASLIIMLFIWSCHRASAAMNPGWRARALFYGQLAAAFTLPGLLIATAVVGSTVLEYPRDNLVYGAKSLSETFASIASATLYEPNPYVINPLLYPKVVWCSRLLLPLLAVLCGWRLFVLLMDRMTIAKRGSDISIGFALLCAGTLALTLAAHWIAFRCFQILLPKERTAIYLAVLITLLVGSLAAIPVPSGVGQISRAALTASLLLLGLYYLGCLRLTYFKEWRFDSDMRNTYAVLAYYNHTCGLKEAPANWRYDGSLNFYWTISRREDFIQFYGNATAPYPPGKRVYVLYDPEDHDYLSQHGLKAVYRGENGVVVALNPTVDSTCEGTLPPFGIRWDSY
jgi:hypothetical protein